MEKTLVKPRNPARARKVAPKVVKSAAESVPVPPAPRAEDDPLTPQEELFVELYFALNFSAKEAYSRSIARPGTRQSSVATEAYRVLNAPPIQAAILRRRAVLREERHASREEKIGILEGIMRDTSQDPCERIRAIRVHNLMVGEECAPITGQHGQDRLTAAALRALPLPEFLAQINRGAAARVLPAPVTIDVQPLNGNGHTNGNGKTHGGTNGNGNHGG